MPRKQRSNQAWDSKNASASPPRLITMMKPQNHLTKTCSCKALITFASNNLNLVPKTRIILTMVLTSQMTFHSIQLNFTARKVVLMNSSSFARSMASFTVRSASRNIVSAEVTKYWQLFHINFNNNSSVSRWPIRKRKKH